MVANPKITIVKLAERRTVAERTMAFLFEKPSDFGFTPGQFIDMTLPHLSGSDPAQNTRAFSITSAPQEQTLMVATRLRDTAFKRELQRMPLGTPVQIEGPFGNLVLPTDESRPAVLLAGGIGITPFRSMVISAAMQQSSRRLVLFYSNRRPEDAPFLEELQELQQKNPQYLCVGTMTDVEKSSRPWQGQTGRITAELLSKYLVDVRRPMYYVVGPPGMVTGLRTMLVDAQIDDRDIRTEKFVGY